MRDTHAIHLLLDVKVGRSQYSMGAPEKEGHVMKCCKNALIGIAMPERQKYDDLAR